MNVDNGRQLPKAGGITTIHREIRDTVFKFQAEMKRLESELPNQIHFEAGPVSLDTMKIVETKISSQMFSRVVQVFAALAVEAFVNEYGYLRLGEEEFQRKFKRPVSISAKLTIILRETFDDEIDAAQATEIIDLVKRLASRRNRLVHPKPEMELWGEDGKVSKTTERLPSLLPEAANAAVHEMGRFFELFSVIDPEAAFHLDLDVFSRNQRNEGRKGVGGLSKSRTP